MSIYISIEGTYRGTYYVHNNMQAYLHAYTTLFTWPHPYRATKKPVTHTRKIPTYHLTVVTLEVNRVMYNLRLFWYAHYSNACTYVLNAVKKFTPPNVPIWRTWNW